MNNFAGLFGDNFKNLFVEAIDELISSNALAVECKLFYDTTGYVYCNNCVYDPILQKSFNKYNNTGPINFAEGSVCPVCVGFGKILCDSEENIHMAVILDSKYWMNWGSNSVLIPNLAAQTLTQINTMPKILNSSKMNIVSVTGYDNGPYTKAGQPTPMGLGRHNYILTNWIRP
jgi:hypothetical protein